MDLCAISLDYSYTFDVARSIVATRLSRASQLTMRFPKSSQDVIALAKTNVAIAVAVFIALVASVPIVVPLACLAYAFRAAFASAPSAPKMAARSIDAAKAVANERERTEREGESAPVALTGSAALMAKMRMSAATTGEKRVAERVARSEGATTSEGAKANEEILGRSTRGKTFVLHGGEAAREIAKELARGVEASTGETVGVLRMDDFRDVKFEEEPSVMIFVVETVENAQPAEAAGACVRYFNRQRKDGGKDDSLKKMSFAVLGLGDTNLLLDRQSTTAKDCNQAAQTLDSALGQLGATRIVARGEANDAVGLERAVDPWSKSLFAKLSNANKALTDKKSAKMCFLYGSQTGNAAEICKNLAAEAGEKGYPVQVCSMNEVEPDDVVVPGAVITFVVSSTGDGDAPDNCDTFYTRLKRKAKKEGGSGGKGVQYAVLGLGDQNYSAFMAVPRSFTQIMESLGAIAFAKRGECDDTLGLYEQVDTWTLEFWPKLSVAHSRSERLRAGETIEGEREEETLKVESTAHNEPPSEQRGKLDGVPALAICRSEVVWLPEGATYESGTIPTGPDENGAYTVAAPYMASISKHVLLTNPKSDRRVLHLEFDLDSSGITYRPGDSIGVIPQNSAELVQQLVKILGYVGTAAFSLKWKSDTNGDDSSHPLPHVRTPCTVTDALLKYVDITSCPRKSLVRVLAEHCSDAKDKTTLLHLSSRGGKDDYDTQIRGGNASLLTILQRHPSCKPPLAELLDALPPLAPRLYSITSAPEVAPKNPSVAFSVVKYEAAGGETRLGVATNWLDALTETAAPVPLYIKPSLKFGLPADASAPLILIGPGTGVAPFRGFLQSRREATKNGAKLAETILFFGCRKRDEDFLYESDWNQFVADGTLSKFICAFSRETDEKVYVQHKLRENSYDVARLIANGAYIMVCGDGSGMAKDVHSALIDILVTARVFGLADAKAAEVKLAEFTKSGRYVRDIWS